MSSSARAASYVVLSKWAVTLHSCLKAEENDMPPRAALVRSVLEQQRRLAAAWGAGQEDEFVARRGRRSGVRQEQRRPAHLVSLATREGESQAKFLRPKKLKSHLWPDRHEKSQLKP